MEPALEEAFAAFVRERGEYFMRLAVLLAGTPPEAEDLLQASLVRLYQAWPRLDVTDGVPDAYLRKILVKPRGSGWALRALPGAAAPRRLGPRAAPWCGRRWPRSPASSARCWCSATSRTCRRRR